MVRYSRRALVVIFPILLGVIGYVSWLLFGKLGLSRRRSFLAKRGTLPSRAEKHECWDTEGLAFPLVAADVRDQRMWQLEFRRRGSVRPRPRPAVLARLGARTRDVRADLSRHPRWWRVRQRLRFRRAGRWGR